MIRQILTALTVVMCLALACAQDANLVPNAGFEQVEGGAPVGWTVTGGADLDNAQFYAGAMGLRMVHEQAMTSTARLPVQSRQGGALAAVWVRTEGVRGTGAVLRILGPDGQLIAATEPATGDSGWHLVQVEFNSGNANPLTVDLSLRQATGSAWFDDVMVGEAAGIRELLPADQAGPARENIALGRPYVLSPPPSYKLCTDEGDYEQLTDGEYTVGYFWTQASTVGWYLYSPQIIVDLGETMPIEGIMINCPGGGAAGVKFPQEVVYYVSEDNENYHEVARLTPLGLLQDGKNWYTHRFLADDLNTRGRYVMIFLDKAGSTAFADEIEVYRGDHNPGAVTFNTAPVSRTEMAFAQYGIKPESFTQGHFPQTPHIKWATPLASGPVKSIVMAFSANMRDVAELAQRLDIDYVPVQHFSYRTPKALGMLMQEQIANALPECEVMVVGGYYWQSTPDDLLAQIRERVREGMGLVVVSPQERWHEHIKDIFEENPIDGDEGVLDLVPMDRLPQYHPPRASHLSLNTYGDGRVALLTWQNFTRAAHSLLPAFLLEDIDDDAMCPIEYSYAALAKSVLWAARRETEQITSMDVGPEHATITVAPGEAAGKLTVEVLDRYFDQLATQTVDVPAEGGAFDVAIPAHMAGATYVNAWLRDDQGKVVDFGSAASDNARQADIVSVELDRAVYASGEELRATVTVQGDTAGMLLAGRLVDTYGRQVGSVVEVAPTAAGAAEVVIQVDHPITLAASLWVTLHAAASLGVAQAGDVVDRELTRVWMDRPEDPDEFVVCAWYAWDFQPHAYHGLQWVRDYGVDTYVSLGGDWRAENAAWANIRHGPENVDRVIPANTDESLVRKPCLTDPEHRAKIEAKVRAYASSVRPFGVLEWSLGDESSLGRRDYCVSPTCLAAFRDWLRDAYGGLPELNASWGTDFARWDQVVPATRDEVGGQDRLGPWLDHRRYMERLFTDYHAWLRDVITSEIPAARVGISGTPRPNSYSGHDWWQLMQEALDHLSGYGGIQRELQRSFMQPRTFYSTFLGYDYRDNNEQRARYGPWDLLLHGANGINYYTLVSNTLNCPLIRPDGSLANHAPWFFEEVRELKAGTARQIMLGDYSDDRIAVHYSPPSVHGATAVGLFDPRDRFRNYQTNMTNVGTILQECHYQYDFIHEDQMAAGALADYSVLIMPWSSCVSEAEAEAIETFVRGGGTLIADSFCGVRDGHGAPRAMLDHLFGIRQPLDVPELAPAELMLTEAHPAFTQLGDLVPVRVASGSPTVELDGARAMAQAGDMPAFIANQVGDGMAVFLNCSFSNYSDVRATGVAGETEEEIKSPDEVSRSIRDFVRGLLSERGIQSPLSVQVEGGKGPQIEVSRFDVGEGMLVGAVRSISAGPIDPDDLLGCTITLPEAAHVYDIRAGKYLGNVTEISDRLPRGIARLYAALPYRVDGLALTGPGQARAGEAVALEVSLDTGGAEAGPHAVRVTVSGPDGTERAYHSTNLTAWSNKARASLPLSPSDEPGDWTITARDIISGQQAALTLTVSAE